MLGYCIASRFRAPKISKLEDGIAAKMPPMRSALIFVSCPRCPAERSTLRHCSLTRGAQYRLDLTNADMPKGLLKELQGKRIAVYAADMHAPVREFSQRTGLLELIGEDHIFPTVDAAVRFLETDAA